jgi:hypothetical protein
VPDSLVTYCFCMGCIFMASDLVFKLFL